MSSDSHGCVNIEILSSLHLRSAPQDDGMGASTCHDVVGGLPQGVAP